MANEQEQQQEQELSEEKSTPKTIPYARFKEVNDKYSALEKQLTDMQSKQKQQEETTLKEQSKFKELYEQTGEKLTAAESKALRLEIALEKGLTIKQANRLVGSTKEELLSDADEFLSDLGTKEKSQTPPGVPPLKGGGSATFLDVTKEDDPAKIREAYRKGQVK